MSTIGSAEQVRHADDRQCGTGQIKYDGPRGTGQACQFS